MNYRLSHLAPNKGQIYHGAFNDNPYRSIVWKMEKEVLDSIIANNFPGLRISHLDFACGTGRILSFLRDRADVSVGVDISPSMLMEARKNRGHSEIIEGDLTRQDMLEGRQFDLITAFRFFPNAENALREDVMRVLVKHLAEGGVLVFNNHRNPDSTRNRLARLLGRKGISGMKLQEVSNLLSLFQLETIHVHHMCVLPASERRLPVPPFLLLQLERVFAKISVLKVFGENHIYVCRKMGGASPM